MCSVSLGETCLKRWGVTGSACEGTVLHTWCVSVWFILGKLCCSRRICPGRFAFVLTPPASSQCTLLLPRLLYEKRKRRGGGRRSNFLRSCTARRAEDSHSRERIEPLHAGSDYFYMLSYMLYFLDAKPARPQSSFSSDEHSRARCRHSFPPQLRFPNTG